MKIKEKSTEEKVIRKYLLRLRQPRIKKKENRYYIRGYKGTEVIIRTDHEILKRIAYRRTCVKQVCIPGRYGTEIYGLEDHMPRQGGLIQSYNEILRDYDKT